MDFMRALVSSIYHWHGHPSGLSTIKLLTASIPGMSGRLARRAGWFVPYMSTADGIGDVPIMDAPPWNAWNRVDAIGFVGSGGAWRGILALAVLKRTRFVKKKRI
jgi:hypothetical protein